jgi:hypothetical protein
MSESFLKFDVLMDWDPFAPNPVRPATESMDRSSQDNLASATVPDAPLNDSDVSSLGSGYDLNESYPNSFETADTLVTPTYVVSPAFHQDNSGRMHTNIDLNEWQPVLTRETVGLSTDSVLTNLENLVPLTSHDDQTCNFLNATVQVSIAKSHQLIQRTASLGGLGLFRIQRSTIFSNTCFLPRLALDTTTMLRLPRMEKTNTLSHH